MKRELGILLALAAGVAGCAGANQTAPASKDAYVYQSNEAGLPGGAFDQANKVTITGTVREFQYTNPRSWLKVAVTDSGSKETVWGFVGNGPSGMLRAGIKVTSFQPGDKVTVVGLPLKDGRHAAVLVNVTKADGTLFEAAPRDPA